MSLLVPVSWGEFFDKLVILQIKQERIADPAKLKNIKRELEHLSAIRDSRLIDVDGLDDLLVELRRINEKLWDIEDDIRECERGGDFGARFVQLARSVYRSNDSRAEIKQRINLLLGSELIEEKSYQAY